MDNRLKSNPSIRRRLTDATLFVADAAGVIASLSGASVVAFAGKFALAAILAALSLGFFLRIVGCRRATSSVKAPAPSWWVPLASVLTLAEVAVLVEAADLPVRFSQPGFELYHWMIVLLAVVGGVVLHLQVFRAFGAGRRVTVSS